MDFLLFPDLRGTNLPYPSGCPPELPSFKAQPFGNLDLRNTTQLFRHGEPLPPHLGNYQDGVNNGFFLASPRARFASISPAQHQVPDLFTSNVAPLLCSYSNKENELLDSSGCYSPTSRTDNYPVLGPVSSFSSSTTLLSSPFPSKAPASPLAISTPIKFNKVTRRLSPIPHFSDGPFEFMKDIDSPRCLTTWPSSDPALSPVIRACTVPSSHHSSKSQVHGSVLAKLAMPVTPGRQNCSGPRRQFLSHPTTLNLEGEIRADDDAGNSGVSKSMHFSLSPWAQFSPLTPCSSPNGSLESTNHNHGGTKRALVEESTSSPSPLPHRKRRRYSRLNYKESSSPLSSITGSPVDTESMLRPEYSSRSFQDVEISPYFPLFYRRYPISSYLQLGAESPCSIFQVRHPGGHYNSPRSPFDLYTPRFVKGKGTEKVGLCPICIENPSRGGAGKALWLAMKFSAFNYHMQYSHGISASTGLPFAPPKAFRIFNRVNPGRHEKATTRQGKCHKCLKWVAIEGIKAIENKVKEIYWWKHAAACHQGSRERSNDMFEKDVVYQKLLDCGVLEEA